MTYSHVAAMVRRGTRGDRLETGRCHGNMQLAGSVNGLGFWSPDESTLVVFVVLCLRRKEPKMNKKIYFFVSTFGF